MRNDQAKMAKDRFLALNWLYQFTKDTYNKSPKTTTAVGVAAAGAGIAALTAMVVKALKD